RTAWLRALHEIAGARSPEDGRVRLADGEAHRAERRAVHALAGNHVTARVDDAHPELERARFCLAADPREQLERDVERRASAVEESVQAGRGAGPGVVGRWGPK